MGRAAKREERLPSQRVKPTAKEATNAELKRQLDTLKEELRKAIDKRNEAHRKVEALTESPPPPPPVPNKTRTIKKIKGETTFYTHAEELAVFLRAFHATDLAPLILAAHRGRGKFSGPCRAPAPGGTRPGEQLGPLAGRGARERGACGRGRH